MMHLPGIKTLYIKGCVDDLPDIPEFAQLPYDDFAEDEWDLQRNTSSVENLFPDSHMFGDDFSRYMIAAPRNLKTLAFRETFRDRAQEEEFGWNRFQRMDSYIGFLAANQSASIESVMSYNCTSLDDPRPPRSMYNMNDLFALHNLKHMYISLYEICPGFTDWSPDDQENLKNDERLTEPIMELLDHARLEGLVFGLGSSRMEQEKIAQRVDAAFATALKSGSG